jgi:hypothetical protein
VFLRNADCRRRTVVRGEPRPRPGPMFFVARRAVPVAGMPATGYHPLPRRGGIGLPGDRGVDGSPGTPGLPICRRLRRLVGWRGLAEGQSFGYPSLAGVRRLHIAGQRPALLALRAVSWLGMTARPRPRPSSLK